MLKKVFSEENLGVKPGKALFKFVATFLLVNVVFVGILTLAWCIPADAIRENYEASMEIFEEEGYGWNRTFTYASGSMLDNYTDNLIIGSAMSSEAPGTNSSALTKAMSVNGYSRYWHGYLALVRPLLLAISYTDMRYILMLIFVVLFCVIINGINKRLTVPMTIAFAVTMALAYFNILPYCIQFSNVFVIAMVMMAYLLYRYRTDWKLYRLCSMFLIIGMITQFMDLLTAPLITLGMPLAVILLINVKELGENARFQNWCAFLFSSASWAFGWALCWFAKWIIGGAVLQNDLMDEALHQASFRVNGTAEAAANRLGAVWKNLYSMMPFSSVIGKGEKIAMILVACMYLAVIIIGIVLFVKYNRGKKLFFAYVPLLCLGLLPYVWFLLMAQHSQIHNFFTYRIQVITCFSFLTAYMGMIAYKPKKK